MISEETKGKYLDICGGFGVADDDKVCFDPDCDECKGCQNTDPEMYTDCKTEVLAVKPEVEEPVEGTTTSEDAPGGIEAEEVTDSTSEEEKPLEVIPEPEAAEKPVAKAKKPKSVSKTRAVAIALKNADGPMLGKELSAAVYEACGGSKQAASSVTSLVLAFAIELGAVVKEDRKYRIV